MKEPTFNPEKFPKSLNDFTPDNKAQLLRLPPTERIKFYLLNYDEKGAFEIIESILTRYNVIEVRFLSLWNRTLCNNSGYFSPFPFETVPDYRYDTDNYLSWYVAERLCSWGAMRVGPPWECDRWDEQGYCCDDAYTMYYFKPDRGDIYSLLRSIESAKPVSYGLLDETPFVFIMLACINAHKAPPTF